MMKPTAATAPGMSNHTRTFSSRETATMADEIRWRGFGILDPPTSHLEPLVFGPADWMVTGREEGSAINQSTERPDWCRVPVPRGRSSYTKGI